ncbi:MAG: hypothetical protein HZA01_04675 [Nitrospinae bacterium]|nr:hypothetical protein [Nitrospinota bacterium]
MDGIRTKKTQKGLNCYKNLTAEYRSVETGRTVNGETIVVKGLEPGEKVVTDGQLRLIHGTQIQIKNGAEEKKQ